MYPVSSVEQRLSRIEVERPGLEVDVDLDLDGLVTQAASLDALRQRFGRLNRAGRPLHAEGTIIALADDIAKIAHSHRCDRNPAESRQNRKPLRSRSVGSPPQRCRSIRRRQEGGADTSLSDVRSRAPAFSERLASVPQQRTPPDRGKGHGKTTVSETDCLHEALFASWTRPDKTKSFRWDPNEDVRYALRARDPTDAETKETTQHGANRLAAVGLSVLTVVPKSRGSQVKLTMLGGQDETNNRFAFRWPIWRAPISLAGIRALLCHPWLERPETRTAPGVVDIRRAWRISVGKFINITRADSDIAP